MIWIAAVLAAVVVAAALWLRSRYVVITVRGGSMSPTFDDGERLLVRRCPGDRCRPGDLAVFANPIRENGAAPDPRWLVKRVTAAVGDAVPEEMREAVGGGDCVVPTAALLVRGDAPRSQDSRHFGYVPTDTVLGTVVRKL